MPARNRSHNVSNADIVEVKKMRQGLEAAPEAPAPAPKLTGKAAFANFIRYYGVYILIGIAAAAFIVYLVYTVVNNKKPDCLVVVNTGPQSLQAVTGEYSEIFEGMTTDTNGDGRTLIEVMDCSYDTETGNPEINTAMAVKYQAQFGIEYAQLFILSEETLKNMDEQLEGNFLVDDLGLSEYNGKAVKLNGTRYEEIYRKSAGTGFEGNVYLCMRRVSADTAKTKRGKAADRAARDIIASVNKEVLAENGG